MITKNELISSLKVKVFYHSVFGIKNLASARFLIKKLTLIGMFLVIMPFILADYEGMMEYGMMGSIGMSLYAILWFAIATFVFSWIFWSVYRWVIEKRKTKR